MKPPRLIGLVLSHREGRLAYSCVQSLRRACDLVLVHEGPIAGIRDVTAGDVSEFPKRTEPGCPVVVMHTHAGSDVAKRNYLLEWARERAIASNRATGHGGRSTWALVVDADEVLLWPELLPDYLRRAEAGEPGGLKLKIVEADGTVQESAGRCYRLDLVERYLTPAQIMLASGIVWSVPLALATRPPIQGEPHILHRSYLRPPERNAPGQRLSRLELDELARLGQPAAIR